MGPAALLTPERGRTPSPLWLWTAILAGPCAWALDLSSSYALVKWACAHQGTDLLRLMTLAAVGVAAAGGALSASALARTRDAGPIDGGRALQRARFMAMCGLLSSAFFALAILALGLPKWVLDACQ